MKKAICVGINNYPGTSNDLLGCVNDANNWASLLKNTFDFDVATVINKYATKQKILASLQKMIAKAEAGDVVVFTYSGHGTWILDVGDRDEPDGYDEALYVFDGMILDDEVREIINTAAPDVTMIFIIDSCFSGTITRSALPDVQKSLFASRKPRDKATYSRPRFMPPEDDELSLRIITMPRRRRFLSEEDMKEITLTGCSDNEYSYDTFIDNKAVGAMSAAALSCLSSGMTYEEWHTKIRYMLPSYEYPQTPQLEGTSENKNREVFVGIEIQEPEPIPEPTPEPEPEPTPETSKPEVLTAEVLTGRLRLRSGPGRNYSTIGMLRRGDTFTFNNFDGREVWVEVNPGEWAAFIYRGRQHIKIVDKDI
jgi:hypothetical protein